jgi:hypothetical protein
MEKMLAFIDFVFIILAWSCFKKCIIGRLCFYYCSIWSYFKECMKKEMTHDGGYGRCVILFMLNKTRDILKSRKLN